MSSTVATNNQGTASKTSGHEFNTIGPTDVCMDPTVTVPVPHPNTVNTDKAVEHTTGKTLVQGGNVVRVQEAVMPSDPAHPDIGAGGGVASHTYRMEARAAAGSPDVRMEGKPPARTDDPTTQNHGNAGGKIVEPVPPQAIQEKPDEAQKRCSYDTSTIKKEGEDSEGKAFGAVKMPQIDVKRGSTIIVEAKRKNAKVPDAPPDCSQPPHMKWKVTRTGGMDLLGAAIPEKVEELTGDTLTLKDWLPALSKLEADLKLDTKSDAAKKAAIEDKNRYAQENAASRGSARVENEDARAAYKQVSTDRKRREMAMEGINQLANFTQALVVWRAAQNPIRLAIVGNACSGAVTYEVHGYPEHKYEIEIPLEGLIKVGRWISRAMSVARSVGQLANCPVENSVVCPGDVKFTLGFEWKEGAGDDQYYAIREAYLAVSSSKTVKGDLDAGDAYKKAMHAAKPLVLAGALLAWQFDLSFPFTNLLTLIPVAGAGIAKAVGWLNQRLGIEAKVGVAFNLKFTAEGKMAFSWCKKWGWKWAASIKVSGDFKFFLYIRVKWKDSVHMEARAEVNANPSLLLEGGSDGLALFSEPCEIKPGFTGSIVIDVWFYSYDKKFECYPESWKIKFVKTELWKLIAN